MKIALKSFKKRLNALEPYIPETAPWPPDEGSLSWCLYQSLGRPVARMDFMDMYLEVSKKVWEGDLE
jgi:hypothetical protein